MFATQFGTLARIDQDAGPNWLAGLAAAVEEQARVTGLQDFDVPGVAFEVQAAHRSARSQAPLGNEEKGSKVSGGCFE